MRLQALISDSEVDPRQLCVLFGVTEETARRWLRTQKFPSHVRFHLELAGGHSPGWTGYKIRPGKIIVPGGETVTKEQIRSFHYIAGMLHRETRISEAHQARASRRYEEVQEELFRGADAILRELRDYLTPKTITSPLGAAQVSTRSDSDDGEPEPTGDERALISSCISSRK